VVDCADGIELYILDNEKVSPVNSCETFLFMALVSRMGRKVDRVVYQERAYQYQERVYQYQERVYQYQE
jgi:hypothetical protein